MFKFGRTVKDRVDFQRKHADAYAVIGGMAFRLEGDWLCIMRVQEDRGVQYAHVIAQVPIDIRADVRDIVNRIDEGGENG